MHTIGIMMTNFFGEYVAQIWPGMLRATGERNVNLMVFPARTDNRPEGYVFQQSVIYSKITPDTVDALVIVAGTYSNQLDEDEYNTFFERFRDIPGVSIGSRVPQKSVILVDNTTGLEKLVRHVLSEHGRKNPAMITGPRTNEESCERLRVFQKTCGDFGYSIGPEQVFEGDFTVPSGHAAVRTLFPSDRKAAHPDALICANDNMAFGAMRELKKRGYRVPADVSVTGFDNVNEARFSFPALSTVSQPLEEQGYQAVMRAADLAEGIPVPEKIILSGTTVLRSSCGCYSATGNEYARSFKNIDAISALAPGRATSSGTFWDQVADLLPVEEQTLSSRKVVAALVKSASTGKNLETTLNRLGAHLHSLLSERRTVRPWVSLLSLLNIYLQKINIAADRSYEAAGFLGSCLQVVISMLQVEQGMSEFRLVDQIASMRTYLADIGSALTIDDISEATLAHLTALGVRSFYIAIYDRPVIHKRGDPWTEPDCAHLVIGYHNGRSITGSRRSKLIRQGRLLPQCYAAGKKPRFMIASSLHFRDEIIGFMMIDQTDITREIYDILVGHISTALKTAALFAEREASEKKLLEVLHELEQSNTQLQKISEIDELTGLYNRRGFMNFARRSMELARQMGRGGLVFYGDLDGLKKINDVHGHKEGDLAIITAAVILRRAFRNMDIVSRLGGDEFVILAPDNDERFLPVFRERLDLVVAAENAKLGKPWKVSISIGAAPFVPGESTPLEKLMSRADESLYLEKQRKRKAL